MKQEEAEGLFRVAGFKVKRTWELPNGYCGGSASVLRDIEDKLSPNYTYPPLEERIKTCLWPLRSPWWLVLTDFGPIEIGWRKRVISIDWSATNIRGVVTTDETTKGLGHVHAWTMDAAVRYLTALRAMVPY